MERAIQMNKPVVAVIMGSKSDLPILQGAFKIFDEFRVPFTARVLSAHRTPVEAAEFASGAEAAGYRAIICAAGMAAHLGGVVAAHTTLPVIGIPVAKGGSQERGALRDLDSCARGSRACRAAQGVPPQAGGAGASGGFRTSGRTQGAVIAPGASETGFPVE